MTKGFFSFLLFTSLDALYFFQNYTYTVFLFYSIIYCLDKAEY